ncbi:OmpA family protein [Variovorax saccharolyticus]|uniref:OmpA family protein n=1 Tax=Variovorax saccharolyticus TaxID=3053516 RepID=UPI002576C7A8|nr:OmpA family protein [Variovorax sp. J31P216]MDM0029120.1 OmpA family protein [Variovorax sp. J31P216]
MHAASALGMLFVCHSAVAQSFASVVDSTGSPVLEGAQAPSYWTAKAMCWDELAKVEASQGDTRETAEIATRNAQRIRAALQRGTEPGAGAEQAEQPIFTREHLPSNDSRHGRPQWRADIARIDAVVRRYHQRSCRTPRLGCLEVALQSVFENMEETQGARWNHGRPEIDKALVLAQQAEVEFAACAPQLQAVQVPSTMPLEVIELPSDMLFRFDQSGPEGLLPAGRKALTDLAQKVQNHGERAGVLEVVGHTDRLGTTTYNLALSAKRAATVAGLLRAAGVTLTTQEQGIAAAMPVTGDDCRVTRPHQLLVDCLQPDRRVTVRIMPKAPTPLDPPTPGAAPWTGR